METKVSQITPEYLAALENTLEVQRIEELASLHQETNHLPDPYYWTFDLDGDLCTPATGIKINSKIRRESFVDQVEGLVFDKIFQYIQTQRRSTLAERKPIVWVSPPHLERSMDLKIIISELEEDEGGQQILFNRTVLLEYNEQQSLEFGRMLADFNQSRPLLLSLEELRKTPLILNSNHWLRVVEEIAPNPQWQLIKNGADKKLKAEALIQAKIYQERLFARSSRDAQKTVVREMESSGFIGEHANSCPTAGAFEVFSGSNISGSNRTVEKGWHWGTCVACEGQGKWVGKCNVCEKCEDEDNSRRFQFALVA